MRMGPGWWPYIASGPDPLLVKSMAEEWDDASSPFTPMPQDFPKLPPPKDPNAIPPIPEEWGLTIHWLIPAQTPTEAGGTRSH